MGQQRQGLYEILCEGLASTLPRSLECADHHDHVSDVVHALDRREIFAEALPVKDWDMRMT